MAPRARVGGNQEGPAVSHAFDFFFKDPKFWRVDQIIGEIDGQQWGANLFQSRARVIISGSFQRVDDMSESDMQDIIAFLQALTDPNFDRTIPAHVPSRLRPGGI